MNQPHFPIRKYQHPLEHFVLWERAFTPEEIDRIVFYCDGLPKESAQVGSGSDQKTNPKVRESKISWVKPSFDTEWIFVRLADIVKKVNHDKFGFDIEVFEHLQYTTYENNGTYNWHNDCVRSDSFNRKLSLSLLLTDEFDGGDFLINAGSEENCIRPKVRKGDIIFFPSFVNHTVTPVTKGIRKSLVAWCLGPNFI